MKRVLITGMSGTGKSTVIAALAGRGHRAHDLDTPEWSHWVDVDLSDTLTPRQGKDWVWREDRVRALLLSAPDDGILFVSGTAENMAQFYPLIDRVILLTAPVETLMRRLKARSPGGYGHAADDRQKVVDLVATIEPLLRQSCDVEIDTRKPLDAVVAEILRLAER
jgi:shikimate kinase